MKCDNCKWDYPEHLLMPFNSTGPRFKRCCGICALELSNQIHGVKRTEFSGEIAESLRRDAINWRKGHPEP